MIDNRPLMIITARVGSSRLPGKVIKKFWKNYSLLEFLIKRLQAKNETSRLVLAVADTSENDCVADVGSKCGIRVVRGPEDNVLARMALCLKDEQCSVVGRITADNPFTDPKLIISQLEEMRLQHADYSYCRTCPKGMATDLWTSECFNSTVENSKNAYELEHVNAWVWDHPEDYRILWFSHFDNGDQSWLNLSIDSVDEFVFVSRLANQLQNPLFDSVNTIIKLACRQKSFG